MDHVFMERKHQVLSSSLVGNWEGISVRYSNNGSTSSTTIWRNVKIEIANNVLGLRNGKYVLAKGEGYSQWKNYNIPFDVVIKSRQINFNQHNNNNQDADGDDKNMAGSSVSVISNDNNWHQVCGITVEKVHKSVDFTNKVCYDDCYYGSCRTGQLLSFIENTVISSHGSVNNDISNLCCEPSGGYPLNVIWNVQTNHGYMKLMKLDHEAAAIWRAWLAARGLAREIVPKSINTTNNNNYNNSTCSSDDSRIGSLSNNIRNINISASSIGTTTSPSVSATTASCPSRATSQTNTNSIVKEKVKEKKKENEKAKEKEEKKDKDKTNTETTTITATSGNIADRDLCKLCCSGEIDCVIVPCGHYCLCLTCGLGLTTCPFCRRGIDRLQPIFRV